MCLLDHRQCRVCQVGTSDYLGLRFMESWVFSSTYYMHMNLAHSDRFRPQCLAPSTPRQSSSSCFQHVFLMVHLT